MSVLTISHPGNQINKNACGIYGEQRYIQGLVEKAEGKRPLGRLKRRWEIILK
jgi:hypothetical protein